MQEFKVDCRAVLQKDGSPEYLKEKLHIPYCKGSNLDAIWDCLSEKRDQSVILLLHSHLLKTTDHGRKVHYFFDCLNTVNDYFYVKYS